MLDCAARRLGSSGPQAAGQKRMCGRLMPASTPPEQGPLAQLVEQETLNLLVVGSIPTRPTKFTRKSIT